MSNGESEVPVTSRSSSNSRQYRNSRIKPILVSEFIGNQRCQPPKVLNPKRSKGCTAHVYASSFPKKKGNKEPGPLRKKIEKANEVLQPTVVDIEYDHFDRLIESFLKSVKARQDVLWSENPTKARSRKNIVCGLHEILKHVKAGNIRNVFIAKNIDRGLIEGSACDLFVELRSRCLSDGIPFIFCCSKKMLSKCVNKFPYTTAVGVMRFQGFESEYRKIVDIWKNHQSHISFHIDQPGLFA